MKFSALFIVAVTLFAVSPIYSSERYWIFFRDKGGNEHLQFLKQQQLIGTQVNERAQQRRQLRGLENMAEDFLQQDLPLDQNYLVILKNMGFRIHAQSRWLNGVSGYASAEVIEQVAELPFVNSVEKVKSWHYRKEIGNTADPETVNGVMQTPNPLDWGYGPSLFQNEFHQITELHQKDLNGYGILIGVFDSGFRFVNHAVTHIPPKVIAEYDFVQMDSVTANEPGDPSSQDRHGTLVLSILAGFLSDSLIGPAFGANFVLAKTELIDQEVHLEEDNWAMAAEWAEGLGVDIVTSSLGYSEFDPGQANYHYEDMDGNTTIITKAANELTHRGVLVVNSAGNEGNSSWRYITAPADGPQVLAVGAVNDRNQVSSFSSRGPTADDRIKPDVVALGEQVFGATPGLAFTTANGTSVSCPLVAGIAAQLLQSKPDLNIFELLNIIRNSADNSGSPDNERGWGKVNALAAWNLINREEITDFRTLPPTPNPSFSGNFSVFFPVELPEPANIHLEIFNVLGQKIFEDNYSGTASQNLITWDTRKSDGSTVAAGIYLYRISAGSWKYTGKLTILN